MDTIDLTPPTITVPYRIITPRITAPTPRYKHNPAVLFFALFTGITLLLGVTADIIITITNETITHQHNQ